MAPRWDDPPNKDNENYSVTETNVQGIQIFVTRGLAL